MRTASNPAGKELWEPYKARDFYGPKWAGTKMLQWTFAGWGEQRCLEQVRELVLSKQALIGWPRASFSGRAQRRNLVRFWLADTGLSMSDSMVGLICWVQQRIFVLDGNFVFRVDTWWLFYFLSFLVRLCTVSTSDIRIRSHFFKIFSLNRLLFSRNIFFST